MKKQYSLLLSLACSCGIAQAKLNVVATTSDLAAIAREIGGEHVELTTLARPTEDPHFVDPKPSFVVKLNRADALIQGGAELGHPAVSARRAADVLPGHRHGADGVHGFRGRL